MKMSNSTKTKDFKLNDNFIELSENDLRFKVNGGTAVLTPAQQYQMSIDAKNGTLVRPEYSPDPTPSSGYTSSGSTGSSGSSHSSGSSSYGDGSSHGSSSGSGTGSGSSSGSGTGSGGSSGSTGTSGSTSGGSTTSAKSGSTSSGSSAPVSTNNNSSISYPSGYSPSGSGYSDKSSGISDKVELKSSGNPMAEYKDRKTPLTPKEQYEMSKKMQAYSLLDNKPKEKIEDVIMSNARSRLGKKYDGSVATNYQCDNYVEDVLETSNLNTSIYLAGKAKDKNVDDHIANSLGDNRVSKQDRYDAPDLSEGVYVVFMNEGKDPDTGDPWISHSGFVYVHDGGVSYIDNSSYYGGVYEQQFSSVQAFQTEYSYGGFFYQRVTPNLGF